MSRYIPFTDEQKLRAGDVNLEKFLLRHGEKLIVSGQEKMRCLPHTPGGGQREKIHGRSADTESVSRAVHHDPS